MSVLTTTAPSVTAVPAEPRRRLPALVGAVGVSSVGDGMAAVAFPLLALRFTSSPLLVALVAVAGRLPAAALALPAGVLADRFDRRRLVTATNIGCTAALAVFAAALATGAAGLAGLYTTVVVLGAGEVLVDVALQSAVPEVVPRHRLPAIGGYLSGADVGGESLAGPALGGVLIAAGAWLPFVGDAASFVASTMLARIALPEGRPARSEATSIAADLGAGVRLYLRTPVLRTVALVVGSLAACSTAVTAVLVVFCTRHLGLGAAGYGAFLAGAAAGQVAGHVAAGRAWQRFGPGRSLVAAAGVAGCCYLGLAASSSVLEALPLLALESFAVGVGASAAVAVRQLVTPPDLMGRSSAAYRTVVLGLVPIGALGGGLVAGAAGAPVAIAAAGAATLVVAGLSARPLLRLVIDIR